MIWLSVIAFLTAAFAAGGVVRWAHGHAAAYGHEMPQRFHLGNVPRLGGLVAEGSVTRTGGEVRFSVTDGGASLPVVFAGIPPDLFREGQGVVVEGRLHDGVFVADQVLAKHDEKYMPPEVADALKQSGQWQHMKDSLQQAGQMPGGTSGKGTP